MSISHKVLATVRLVWNDGPVAAFYVFVDRYGLPVPQSAESKWRRGVKSELRFWDAYLATQGSDWPDDYRRRLEPDAPLQPEVAAFLPAKSEVHILDVGAGPLTYLGKKHEGKQVLITAVDPLTDEFDKMLEKHHVRPIVRTQAIAAESLSQHFLPNTFDLVFARNCIDHSCDPEQAILQMLEVVREESFVLLEHRPNEAAAEHYAGLHQWNLSVTQEGDFLIRSRRSSVNMSRKYAALCRITCVLDTRRDWLITRIQKTADRA